MIAIMWRFDVKNGRETDFEQLYGADGEWTAMNRQTRSYLGSSFLRDQNEPSRYMVIEYWSEMIVYERHRASHTKAVASIEDRSTTLVKSVEPMGIFTTCSQAAQLLSSQTEQQVCNQLSEGRCTETSSSPSSSSSNPRRDRLTRRTSRRSSPGTARS